MRKWLVSLLVSSIVLMVVAGFFEGFYIASVWSALLASVILSIVNVLIKPILILLTLPVTILSLGLFLIVINAITLMMTAFLMGDAFRIDGFLMAIIAAIVIGVLNLLIDKVIVKPISNS